MKGNNNTVYRKELCDLVREHLNSTYMRNYDKKQVKQIIDGIFDVLKETLKKKRTIVISTFGVFENRKIRPRRYFDINTRKMETLATDSAVKFKRSVKF